MMPWVGLRCVIVVFPDHTRLLFVLKGVKASVCTCSESSQPHKCCGGKKCKFHVM